MVFWGMYQLEQKQEGQIESLFKRPRARCSLWELSVACLLVFVGAITSVYCVLGYLGYLARGRFTLSEVLLYGTWMLQSSFGCLGGLFSLAGSRTLVRWFLTVAAFFSLATTIVIFFQILPIFLEPGWPEKFIVIAAIAVFGLLAFAGILFFLGRWLGRQED